MAFSKKHILGLGELSAGEIETVLDAAESMKEISTRDVKKVPALKGVTAVNLFFEPSTRTRASFEIAEKRLSADVLNFSASQSSVAKGESLVDTARNFEAMGAGIMVIRHGMSGAPFVLARQIGASVINAGDGFHEHPSQALTDIFTIRERKGRIEGLDVLIVGDVLHSRVARSNVFALRKLGAKVRIAGPPTIVPGHFSQMGVEIFHSLERALEGVDVVIMLRVQSERRTLEYFPSIREYSGLYGLTREKLALAARDVMVMHPGPINRGVELTSEIADGPGAVILEQVANGIAVRMAMIYLVARGEDA